MTNAGGASPLVISSTRMIAVEGIEDKRLLAAYLAYLEIPDIQLLDYGGKSRLRRWLQAVVRTPGFDDVQALMIVRDADLSAGAALASVNGALLAAGLPQVSGPSLPNAEARPRVTALIMPPDSVTGAIEDLCLQSVSGTGALRCVDELIDCAAEQGVAPVNVTKARVQAFLAVQREPGKRLGEAGEAGYWRFASEPFDRLAACVRLALELPAGD